MSKPNRRKVETIADLLPHLVGLLNTAVTVTIASSDHPFKPIAILEGELVRGATIAEPLGPYADGALLLSVRTNGAQTAVIALDPGSFYGAWVSETGELDITVVHLDELDDDDWIDIVIRPGRHLTGEHQ